MMSLRKLSIHYLYFYAWLNISRTKNFKIYRVNGVTLDSIPDHFCIYSHALGGLTCLPILDLKPDPPVSSRHAHSRASSLFPLGPMNIQTQHVQGVSARIYCNVNKARCITGFVEC